MEPLPSALSAIDSKKQALVRGIAELLNPHSALDKLRQVLASTAEDIRGQADSQDAAMSVMPDVAAQGAKEVWQKGLPIAGMFLGESRDLNPMSAELLQKAKRMYYTEKVPEEQIRQQTGWFLGPDNQWRQEIADNRMQWDQEGFQRMNPGTQHMQPLRDLVSHPALMQAYPDIESSGVYKLPHDSPYLGLMRQGMPEMDEPPFVLGVRDLSGPGQARSTILHEIQHAVQSLEGFSEGGGSDSPEAIAWAMQRLKTQNPNFDDRNIFKPFSDEAQAYNQATHAGYQRLAGEAEARLVQARAHMTPAKLAAVHPYSMLDVPYNELIREGGAAPRALPQDLLTYLRQAGLQAP